MNQPTEDRIKKLEEEQRQLKEEVRKLREQITEPIKVTRVEIASTDVLNQLKAISQKLDEKFASIEGRQKRQDEGLFMHSQHISALHEDVKSIKTNVEQVKISIDTVKTIQSGHSKFFEEHGRRLSQMATKDDISQINVVLAEILDRLPPKQ